MEQSLRIFIKSHPWIPAVIILALIGGVYLGVTTNSEWIGDVSANFVADLLVAVGVGLIIARYLQSSKETAERRARRAEAYKLLQEELQKNKKHYGELRTKLDEDRLLLSAFKIGRGQAVLQEGVLSGEDLGLHSLLSELYEQLTLFNRYYTILLEDPIRDGKLEVRIPQRNTVKPALVDHLDRLRELLERSLKEVDQKAERS